MENLQQATENICQLKGELFAITPCWIRCFKPCRWNSCAL